MKLTPELLQMKGMLTTLEAEAQAKVQEAYDEIKALLEKHGDNGVIAFVLHGLEMDAKEADK